LNHKQFQRFVKFPDGFLETAPHYYEQSTSDFKTSGDDVFQSTVRLDFREFGRGAENFSWLQIIAGWNDVEELIEAFAKQGHPKAVRLQRADQLAAAVEALTNN
jgi:hypothetical protein